MRLKRKDRKDHKGRKEMPYEDEIPPYAGLAQPSEAINQLAHMVIGVCIDIHRALGPGLAEEAYEEALAIEFDERAVPFQRQLYIPVLYKGRRVTRVRIDFLIASQLVLEAKSCETVGPIDRRQVLRYLEVTKLPLGLLVNFNVMVLKDGIRRIIRSEPVS